MQSGGSDGFKARHALGYGGRVSCLSGGLGRVSERVGVHRHAVAACTVLLLAGCSNTAAAPTVIQAQCKTLNQPVYDEGYGFVIKAIETYYWSDGSKTLEPLEYNCP